MIKRFSAVVVALGLTGAGCASQLGQTMPNCDTDTVTNAVLITAQSVQGAAYVPCVNDLKPGWDYEPLEARSGQTRFWLSSDRVGGHFLEVTFEASCDLSDAGQVTSDEPAIPRYEAHVESDFFVLVTVIPEGSGQELRDYASEVTQEIGSSRVKNRLVKALVDATDSPTADRIDRALDAGGAVMVVGARELEEGTVELHIRRAGEPGDLVVRGLEPDEAVEEVAGPMGDPVYRATWHYPFENGCVTYEFDAEGVGAESIAYDVMDALGFIDLAPIREYGDSVGYILP